MSTRLTYHGAASFEIVGPTHRVLIDPFLSQNPLAPCGPDDLETPDVILVSHAAFDHYGDTASIAKRTGAPVVCDAAVRAMLIDDGVPPDQVSATTWGIVVEAAGHPSSINQAARLAAPGGHVVFIGIPVGDVALENRTFQHVLRQEVSLHGAWNSFGAPFPGRQWTVALDKLASNELRWEFMITHELGLDELPGMFESFRGKNDFFSKVMFRP